MIESENRVSVTEAARLCGICESSLRIWLQYGSCPFGSAIPRKPEPKKKGKPKQSYMYLIIRNRLDDYLGIKKDALPTKVEAPQVDKSENLSTTV